MYSFKGKWITNSIFANEKPINVFHKQNKDKTSKIETPKDIHVLFRAVFTKRIGQAAKLFISADDRYRLYLNGEFVSEGIAPCYPQSYYYHELDVTPFLSDGENTIAVDTYYSGLINRVNVSGDNRQGLIFDLLLDGKVAICSDETVKCAIHTGYKPTHSTGYNTSFNEDYDASSPENNFQRPNYDDGKWQYAQARKHVDYVMVPQPTKPLVYEKIYPTTTTRNNNTIFFDFGEEYVGTFNILVSGKKGSKLTIRYSEEAQNGKALHNLRCNCVYMDTYTLGEAPFFISQYDFKAFRYAEIEKEDDNRIFPDSCYLLARHYPFKLKATCSSQNPKLKRIWELCVKTIKYGVQENYFDCPTRERGQYLYDSFTTAMAHTKLTGDGSMFKKLLHNVAESSFICKGLMGITTCSFSQEIADFSLLFPYAVYQYFKLTNDLDTVKELLPTVTGVIEYFKRYQNRRGLLVNVKDKWNIVDWPKEARDNYSAKLDGKDVTKLHNVINGYYIGALKYTNALISICGEKKFFPVEASERAYISTFRDSDGLFADTPDKKHKSLHSNAIALWFDIGITDDNRGKIVNFLFNKGFDYCNLYGTFMILSAFDRLNERNKLEKLIADDRYWVNMLKEGATRTFEAFGKEKKWNTALFHNAMVYPAWFLSISL